MEFTTEEYKRCIRNVVSEMFIQTKCKTVAKLVQSSSLRQVFDDVARNNHMLVILLL